MADELIDILNEDGSCAGIQKMKSEAHEKGLWHASVQIWIYNSKNEILIQQRAHTKDTYPNLWDISVAGHLSVGDSHITASIREIKEEIGLDISAEALDFLKTVKKSKQPSPTIKDNEFNHLYLLHSDFIIEELKLQTEEVAAVKLIPIKDFKQSIEQNSKEFVPHGKEYYNYIIKNIENKLG